MGIVRPDNKKAMLLSTELFMMDEGLSYIAKAIMWIVTKIVFKVYIKLIAMHKSDGIKPVVSLYGAEVNKLNFVFPSLNKFAQYPHMD